MSHHGGRRHVAKSGDQLPDRHGGDDIVRRQALALSRPGILDRHRPHPTDVQLQVHRRRPHILLARVGSSPAPTLQLQAHRPLPEADLAPEGDDLCRHRLPHLPRAEFGVENALDQAGVSRPRRPQRARCLRQAQRLEWRL